MHRYTEEQIAFMREHFPGMSRVEFHRRFNEHFALALTFSQVLAALKNRGITNGRDSRFQAGHIPATLGQRGIRHSIGTEFKAGHRPHNYRPLGSERVNSDGYLEVKVADPKTWKGKHRMVWEELHGPIPPGHAVIFGDGNKRNLAPENLLLVSRSELAVMNKFGLVGGSGELTAVGRSIAQLRMGTTRKTKNSVKANKGHPFPP